MNIKMIVSDMDGTLLHDHVSMTEETKSVLRKTKAMGIKNVLATGRPYQLMKQFLEETDLFDTMIFANGAVVYDVKSNERTFEKFLDSKDVLDIVKYCVTNDHEYVLYTHDCLYPVGEKHTGFYNRVGNQLPSNQRPNLGMFDDINQFVLEHDIYKVLVIEPDKERFLQSREYINRINDFTITESQSSFLDINAKGVSKGDALKTLAEHENINRSEIMAFGDQENDLTMIQFAEHSFAMENAYEGLKRAAKHITDKNTENGVANAIKKHLLEKF